jgi:hypothetical protein
MVEQIESLRIKFQSNSLLQSEVFMQTQGYRFRTAVTSIRQARRRVSKCVRAGGTLNLSNGAPDVRLVPAGAIGRAYRRVLGLRGTR